MTQRHPVPRRRALAFVLLPSLGLFACAAPQTAAPPARQATLDAVLRRQVESGKVGAIAALVMRDNG
ncbi:hypothetical protein RQ832_08720, partial [Roseomonas sp. DSM 102946]|nr:hypothetical protein [Roseomonas sp. DSM 102946]